MAHSFLPTPARESKLCASFYTGEPTSRAQCVRVRLSAYHQGLYLRRYSSYPAFTGNGPHRHGCFSRAQATRVFFPRHSTVCKGAVDLGL
jgi:hypothetical protein